MNLKIRRLLVGVTLLNVGILLLVISRVGAADSNTALPILRGRGLEIVDQNGNVRAAIQLLPGRADGTFPETVIIRLIDAKGKPLVKIGASAQGSGLTLLGDSEGTYVVLKAEGETSLKMVNKGGGERLVKP